MANIKKVFQSDNWIITKIVQGYENKVRIDAKTRSYIPDGMNRISKWCCYDYANKLCNRKYKKNLEEHSNFCF